MNKTIFSFTALIITVLLFAFNLNAQTQTSANLKLSAKEVYAKASSTVDISNFEMSQTLKIIDAKGNERVRKTTSKSLQSGDATKMLIEFISPADVAGTSMLIYDNANKEDDMWIYLPAMRKTRRIVSNEKGQSFMGSEFSNSDMSKPNENDFNFKFLDDATVNNILCYSIEMTAVSKEIEKQYGFAKQIAYVDKTKLLTYKVEFVDNTGKVYKAMSLSKYEKVGSADKYMAKQIEMSNLTNGRKSIITIDNINTKVSISDADLSPTKLGAN